MKALKYWPFVVGMIVLVVVSASVYPLLEKYRIYKDQEETRRHIDEPESPYWEAPRSPFAKPEEAVIVATGTENGSFLLPVTDVLFEYIEVIDGCAEHFQGECVNVRTGPGIDFPIVTRLRNNIVLKIDGKVERDGQSWFKIVFDETLKYPERVTSDWYVAAEYVRVVLDEGDKTLWDKDSKAPTSTKKLIVVDRSDQTLVAYDGDVVFMETAISTGLDLTPTPRGTFSVFKKTPSRYMQGPTPGLSDDYYDLPGVPWNLYFTHGGAVIHGAYWHNDFGIKYSHGCVNLPPDRARELYAWADLGTVIIVED